MKGDRQSQGDREMRKGFTRTELVVVAILLFGLFMVLMQFLCGDGTAREAARRTTCLYNLKEIGDGLRQYMQDHDGHMPEQPNLGYFDTSANQLDGSQVPCDSICELYPSYIPGNSAEDRYRRMLFWCPSDRNDLSPRGEVVGGTYDAAGNFAGREYRGTGSCWERDERTQMNGMTNVDDISYAYCGEVALSAAEKKLPAELRIMADNEEEGDEAPRSKNERRLYGDYGRGPCGLCLDVPDPAGGPSGKAPDGKHKNEGLLYRFAGGLEKEDNHGTDGVSVLYYDCHGEFDDREWPCPLGMWDSSDWDHYEWDESGNLRYVPEPVDREQ